MRTFVSVVHHCGIKRVGSVTCETNSEATVVKPSRFKKRFERGRRHRKRWKECIGDSEDTQASSKTRPVGQEG